MHFCWHEPHFYRIRKAKTKRRVGTAYKRMDALTRQMGKVIGVDLFKGLTTFKKRVSHEQLLHAWSRSSYTNIIKTIPWNDLSLDIDKFAEGMDKTYLKSTDLAIKSLPPPVNKNLRFDINNPRLRRYMQVHTGELIENITTSTQKIVQRAVSNTFQKGWTPRMVAMHIKDSIGLDERRATALSNYRFSLEKQGKLPEDRIDALTAKYSDELLRQRSMTIGRTETRNATNDGQLSVWREAANQGLIEKTSKKVWVVDGNPCEICEPMDGEAVGLDDVWVLDNGDSVDIPSDAHPNCYCGMELEFGEDEED